jgi:hypothetical protein
MTLDITDQERQFLLDVLETKYAALLHELHHAGTNDYKDLLRHQIDVLERLRAKVGATVSADNAI